MNPSDLNGLLAEQMAFYRAWAPSYDAAVQHDDNELDRAELRDVLAGFDPVGDVLELAGGTGNWTIELARHAEQLTVVDSSPEALTISRTKLGPSRIPVEHVCADIFEWQPSRRYDVVFFSFWLTHLPSERFESFWQLVDCSLGPQGRVFFIDSARPRHQADPAAARSQLVGRRDDTDRGLSWRTLSDGREYRIVKVFWQPDVLRQRLAGLGFDLSVHETVHGQCIYGHGQRDRS
jgi:SAM-dependent methyltransferase